MRQDRGRRPRKPAERLGKLASRARRRSCVEHVVAELGVSERTACRVLGQHRSTRRKIARSPDDEAALTADIVELARRHGRYGSRRITALLRQAGWQVNRKRVERIWRRAGLKVPARQPKRERLWLADGSCLRLRPERPNQVPRPSSDGRPFGNRIIHRPLDDGPTTSSRTGPGMPASSGCCA